MLTASIVAIIMIAVVPAAVFIFLCIMAAVFCCFAVKKRRKETNKSKKDKRKSRKTLNTKKSFDWSNNNNESDDGDESHSVDLDVKANTLTNQTNTEIGSNTGYSKSKNVIVEGNVVPAETEFLFGSANSINGLGQMSVSGGSGEFSTDGTDGLSSAFVRNILGVTGGGTSVDTSTATAATIEAQQQGVNHKMMHSLKKSPLELKSSTTAGITNAKTSSTTTLKAPTIRESPVGSDIDLLSAVKVPIGSSDRQPSEKKKKGHGKNLVKTATEKGRQETAATTTTVGTNFFAPRKSRLSVQMSPDVDLFETFNSTKVEDRDSNNNSPKFGGSTSKRDDYYIDFDLNKRDASMSSNRSNMGINMGVSGVSRGASAATTASRVPVGAVGSLNNTLRVPDNSGGPGRQSQSRFRSSMAMRDSGGGVQFAAMGAPITPTGAASSSLTHTYNTNKSNTATNIQMSKTVSNRAVAKGGFRSIAASSISTSQRGPQQAGIGVTPILQSHVVGATAVGGGKKDHDPGVVKTGSSFSGQQQQNLNRSFVNPKKMPHATSSSKFRNQGQYQYESQYKSQQQSFNDKSSHYSSFTQGNSNSHMSSGVISQKNEGTKERSFRRGGSKEAQGTINGEGGSSTGSSSVDEDEEEEDEDDDGIL